MPGPYLVDASLIVVIARNEVQLEPGAILEIRVTETIHAGHEPEVLEPGVDEADKCRQPDEQCNGQNEKCEHVEGVTKLGHLGDQRQRDYGGGHDGQKDVGPTEDRVVDDVPRLQAGSSAQSRGSAAVRTRARRDAKGKAATAVPARIRSSARQRRRGQLTPSAARPAPATVSRGDSLRGALTGRRREVGNCFAPGNEGGVHVHHHIDRADKTRVRVA